MTAPTVSVIVPAYDAERYLAQALESILAQTWRPLEVVVADDGSRDRTQEIAASYGDPVRVVMQPTSGPAATRNLGLATATGDFVAFLDPDDLWETRKLEIQMACFDEDPRLDACLTHVRMFWDAEMACESERYRDHPRAKPVPGFATTTLLARRAAFDRTRGFDERLWFSDATEWILSALELGLTFRLLPDVLVRHRMHASNLTRRHSEASREEFLTLVKRSLDRRRRDGGPRPYSLPEVS